MDDNGFRFSRDKRLFGVSFTEFTEAATKLRDILHATRESGARIEVLTCEDWNTYQYSKVTFMADEVTEALKERKSYALCDLTKEVWERSMNTSVMFRDDADPQPFMICLSCDKHDDVTRMRFYGQCLDTKTREQVLETLGRPSFAYAIGEGWSKPSLFNLSFGMRLTGIRLSR